MHKHSATSSSSATQSRGDRYQSRWFVVLATATVVAMTSAILLLCEGQIPGRPVYAFSKQTRETGAIVFRDKGCEHCHGVDGIGTDRGPDLSTIGKRWKKDHIEQQIRDGGGGMPPFGDALQSDEVKDLVDYLSAKHKARKVIKQPVPVKPSTDDSGL